MATTASTRRAVIELNMVINKFNMLSVQQQEAIHESLHSSEKHVHEAGIKLANLIENASPEELADLYNQQDPETPIQGLYGIDRDSPGRAGLLARYFKHHLLRKEDHSFSILPVGINPNNESASTPVW